MLGQASRDDRRLIAQAEEFFVNLRFWFVDGVLVLSLAVSLFEKTYNLGKITSSVRDLFLDPRGLPRPRPSPPPLTGIFGRGRTPFEIEAHAGAWSGGARQAVVRRARHGGKRTGMFDA